MSLCSIPIQYSMSRRFTPSNAFESISSSFPPRNLDWLPLMRTSWGTPFPRRAFPPFAEKVPALINMPMPTDVTQVRALMGGINYYRKILPDLSKRLRPNNSLLRKGSRVAFKPAMEKLVREILAELATPPILVFPIWDAVADGSRPFHVYGDACIDGFGAALEQEQETVP